MSDLKKATLDVLLDGVGAIKRPKINFIQGAGVSASIAENAALNAVDVNLAASNLVTFTQTVAASATEELLTQSTGSFHTLDIVFHAYNEANLVTRSQRMLVNRRGTTLSHNVYARIRDDIDIDLGLSITAGTFKLEVTNNESFTVETAASVIVLN